MAINSAVRSVVVPSGVLTGRFTIRVTFRIPVPNFTDSDLIITSSVDSRAVRTFTLTGNDRNWDLEIIPPIDQVGTLNIILDQGGRFEYSISVKYDTRHRTIFYKILSDIFPEDSNLTNLGELQNLDIIYKRTSSSNPSAHRRSTPNTARLPDTLSDNWYSEYNNVPSGSISEILYGSFAFITGSTGAFNIDYGKPFRLGEYIDINGIKRNYEVFVFTIPTGHTGLLTSIKRISATPNLIERKLLYLNQNTKIWVEKIIIDHIDPGFNQINTSIENRGSVIHEALDGTRTRVKGLNDRKKHTIQFSGTSWPKELVDSLQTFYNTELFFGFSQNPATYPDRVFPAIFENLELNTSYSATYTGTGYNIQFTVTEQ